MKFKRLAALALASAMSLSLATPAFASGNTTTVTANYKAVTVAVDVLPNAVAFINPYGLDIDVPEDGNTTTGTPTTVSIRGQQIVSAPMALKNKSAMDLNVSAKVTTTIADPGTGKTKMTLVGNTTKGTPDLDPDNENYVAPTTTKSAYVYIEAKQETSLTGSTSAVSDAAIAAKFAAWPASTSGAAVLSTATPATADNLVTLRAAAQSGGSFSAYKAGSVALVRLAGDCVTAPANGWTTDDTFTATIAYTFTIANIQKYTITLPAANVNGSTVTASDATAAEGDVVTLTGAPDGTTDTSVTFVVKTDEATPVTVPVTVDASDAKIATFTMPAKNVTVTATFS